ncbi:MAG: GAF domain-containing protein [Bacteroidota bacterium]
MNRKITYRNLGIISVSLFVISILIIGYLLYTLPIDISSQLKNPDKLQLRQLSKIIGTLSLGVSMGLGSGLLAVMFLLLGSKSEGHLPAAATTYQPQSEATPMYAKAVVQEQETQMQKDALAERLQKIEQMVQSAVSKDSKQTMEKALRYVCTELDACQGALFITEESEGKRFIEFSAGYAYYLPESQGLRYEFGEGLAGQVAKEGKMINLSTVPDNYITILSGLGKSSPSHLVIAPIIDSEKTNEEHTVVLGVMEIASFNAFTAAEERLIEGVSLILAKVLRAHMPVHESV